MDQDELSTGETVAKVRRRVRDILAREDCELALQLTAEEIATVNSAEQAEIERLAGGIFKVTP